MTLLVVTDLEPRRISKDPWRMRSSRGSLMTPHVTAQALRIWRAWLKLRRHPDAIARVGK